MGGLLAAGHELQASTLNPKPACAKASADET